MLRPLQCVVYFSHSYNPFPGRNHELCWLQPCRLCQVQNRQVWMILCQKKVLELLKIFVSIEKSSSILRYSEALLHYYYIIIPRYSEAGDLRLSGSLHVHLLSGQNNEDEDNCHYHYIIVTFYPVKLWWWSKK